MPASRNTQPGAPSLDKSMYACSTCGKAFHIPPARANQPAPALVEEESARCSRMREITQQRLALAARAQTGIAGVIGNDPVDTMDMVAQRRSLAQLEASLKGEAEELQKTMWHVPEGA